MLDSGAVSQTLTELAHIAADRPLAALTTELIEAPTSVILEIETQANIIWDSQRIDQIEHVLNSLSSTDQSSQIAYRIFTGDKQSTLRVEVDAKDENTFRKFTKYLQVIYFQIESIDGFRKLNDYYFKRVYSNSENQQKGVVYLHAMMLAANDAEEKIAKVKEGLSNVAKNGIGKEPLMAEVYCWQSVDDPRLFDITEAYCEGGLEAHGELSKNGKPPYDFNDNCINNQLLDSVAHANGQSIVIFLKKQRSGFITIG